MKRAGLLRRRPAYYNLKIGLNLLLLAAGWTAFAVLGQSWWQMPVAVFLFPSMPWPNLRHAQAPVRAFCAQRGVPYSQTSLLASYAHVLRHLHTTGRTASPGAGC